MNCPIKAATITRTNTWELYTVTVDECAADILGLEELEYTFRNGLNARDFMARLQADLDAAYLDAC